MTNTPTADTSYQESVSVTYRNDYTEMVFIWTDDGVSFVAVGIDPSDELVLAAVKAEGCDFTHEGRLWVSEF